MKTYQEKLKNPKWQKKRLEIFDRDGWKCTICGKGDEMLSVHHFWYGQTRDHESGNFRRRDPWEYDDESLTTVCPSCHEEEREMRDSSEGDLLTILKQRGFSWLEVHELCTIALNLPKEKILQLGDEFRPR